MGTIAWTSRPARSLALLLSAALIGGVGFAARADSKRFSTKVIKSVSKKRLAGSYRGISEEGTPVSFRLTRAGKIVDFTVPVNLGCETEVADLDGNGAINDSEPGEISKSTKTITLRSAPLRGRKATSHYPLGMTFEYATPTLPADQPPLGTEVVEYEIKTKFKEELFSGPGANIYWPIPKRAAAVHGELFIATRNGPRTGQVPGRTLCFLSIKGRVSTHISALDFDAKKTGP